MNRAALMLAIVAATAPAACGGARSTAWTDPNFSDAAADAAAMSCDPYAQNCSAGSKCAFGCDGTMATVACRADNGGGAVGAVCSSPMACAKGADCLIMPVGGGACRKYCASDGDCATGERCHNVDVTVNCGGPLIPLPLHFCY
jgi:hypothetical protein